MSETVVVIGNFDGVHPGHLEVLAEAHAGRTFRWWWSRSWPHPISVLRPDVGPMLLTGLPERIDLLERAGADRVGVIDFTPQFAQLSPEQFVEQVPAAGAPRADRGR